MPDDPTHPLCRLRLATAPPGRRGLPRAGIFDGEQRLLACIRHNANHMVWTMLDEGFDLHAVNYGMYAEPEGGLTVYYTVVLVGEGPPSVERRRDAAIARLRPSFHIDEAAVAKLRSLPLRQPEQIGSLDDLARIPYRHLMPQVVRWLTAYRPGEKPAG